ncbi:DUF58 domain-containing protein [Luteolibacter ambystomatis]|uniref:DUF58 domain-containing protein n=1 Tax=Luteolibacter ambystomatis TaxID=2824561 RepID=A0A975PFB0_9BACT|nr:DUF58 domain-containing protein [Luteolibacter ambystomatis]QUE51909.1 DUF58 domain-containing protein [Luteolibacter ambystomatis]
MNADLLDADAVSRGDALGIMARKIVEGYRVGEHRSPFHGFAIEFAQHREYAPGDDIRHLDWKVLGRSERYYIRQYEQDTNFVTHLVVDGSASMNYGSAKVTKLQFAKVLAACLAHIILLQRDAVALALVDEDVREYLPRTDNLQRIQHIMDRLAAFQATGKTSLGTALQKVSREAKRRGLVIIISDLFDDEEGFSKALERFTFSGHEVVVFHTLDTYELTFPFDGTWEFRDLESDAKLKLSPDDFRRSYLKNFGEFQARVRRICDKFQAHYLLVDTGKNLAETLSGYLAFRQTLGS